MKWRQQQCGLSIIGLVIVLMIVGALAATLLPMLLSKHNQSVTGMDRKALEAARTAIIGYALSNNGKLPYPVDASGNSVYPSVNGCNPNSNPKYQSVPLGTTGATACLMPPSTGTGTGVVPALGVNNWGAFGKENPFHMDVNDALASAAASGVQVLCSTAQTQLANQTLTTMPRICQNYDDHTTTPCDAAHSTPVAFVLYSTGSDRKPNQNNALNTRIYESDNRGIDNSAGYDDQVVSYPLSNLVSACAQMEGLPVCSLNATPSTIVSGASSVLASSCSNGPILSYNWSNPPGFASNIATSAVAPSVAGTYTYTVSGTNAIGTGPVSIPVTVTVVNASNCTISPNPVSLASNATAQLFTATCNNAPTSYAWTLDGSSVGSSATTYTTVNNLATGPHTLTVTPSNAGGAGTPASATLTVTTLPVCTLVATYTTVPSGGSTPLAASCTSDPLYPITSYTWSNPPGFASNITSGTVNNITATTTYSVSATNSNGTGTAATATVTVSSSALSNNVALSSMGGVASASSQYSANFPVASVNNNERAGANWGGGSSSNGGWNDGTAGVYPDWVEIDFSGTKTIDRVVVYTLQDNYAAPSEPTDTMTFSLYGITNFSVQGWNGTTWDTLGSITGNNLVKNTFSLAPYSTSKIRVNITATAGANDYSRLTEIEAWAASTTAPDCVLTASPTSIVTGSSSTLAVSCTNSPTSYIWTGTGFASGSWTGTVSPTTTTTYSVQGVNAYGTGTTTSATVTVSPTPPTNVALSSAGAVATASSQFSANYPVASVNNDELTGTGWASGNVANGGWNDATNGVFPDWVQIAFSGSKTINQVVVYTLQDNYGAPSAPTDTMTFSLYGVTDFTVQGWNGATWDTLASVSGNNLVKRTIDLATPYTTSMIRVNVTGALGGYSRIVEIQAWGY